MRVTFLSRRNDHELNNNPLIYNPPETEWRDVVSKWLQSNRYKEDDLYHYAWDVVSFDIENRTETEPTREGLLLSSFCIDGENVLTIDNTSVDNNEVFTEEQLKRFLFLSHNSSHEARYCEAANFKAGRLACTMVNSKRLLSGCEGYRFDLISEINRRLGYEAIPIWMDKDIRNEFATCTYFRDDHILYNAADTIRLKDVYYEQRRLGDKLGMSFLLNSLNSRIIPEIASTEVRGIKHNSEKWINIARERKEKADKLCQELNEIVLNQYKLIPGTINPVLKKKQEQEERRSLRLQERKQKLEVQLRRLEEQGKTHLKSYKTQLEQLDQLITNQSCSVIGVEDSNIINWGSTKQVLEVFKQIGCPLPMDKDKKTGKPKPGVGKEARNGWLTTHSGSSYEDVVKKFDLFKKIEHNIKSFGEKWVEQFVRNGRAYTALDSSSTTTGRFSSGSKGKKKDKANLQQIPSRDGKMYRECFEADPGRSLITADYKNCEGIIMIAQSGDLNMKRITEMSDSHSYLGTKCWRNVYQWRYNRTKDPKWKELAETYEMNKSTPEKEVERTLFKNSGGLFPVAYAVSANKVATTSRVTPEEGQIFIDTIKAEIPLVINYLDGVSKKALEDGYCIHNKREGSIRWFQPILDAKHYGWNISKSAKIEIESASRNSVIQGTNSSIIKEAIATICLWAKLFKQDLRFVLTVHDELIFDCPEDKAEFYCEKVKQLMIRAAQNYLIPEIQMSVELHCEKTWTK